MISSIYASPGSNVSLLDVFPALVYQKQSSACMGDDDASTHKRHTKLPVWTGKFITILVCFVICANLVASISCTTFSLKSIQREYQGFVIFEHFERNK